jgi:hypothetical protein
MVILYNSLHGDYTEDRYKEMKLGWQHSKQTETPTQMKTTEWKNFVCVHAQIIKTIPWRVNFGEKQLSL